MQFFGHAVFRLALDQNCMQQSVDCFGGGMLGHTRRSTFKNLNPGFLAGGWMDTGFIHPGVGILSERVPEKGEETRGGKRA